jgi:hypothetical protein
MKLPDISTPSGARNLGVSAAASRRSRASATESMIRSPLYAQRAGRRMIPLASEDEYGAIAKKE